MQVLAAGWGRRVHIWEDLQDDEVIKQSRSIKGHKCVKELCFAVLKACRALQSCCMRLLLTLRRRVQCSALCLEAHNTHWPLLQQSRSISMCVCVGVCVYVCE